MTKDPVHSQQIQHNWQTRLFTWPRNPRGVETLDACGRTRLVASRVGLTGDAPTCHRSREVDSIVSQERIVAAKSNCGISRRLLAVVLIGIPIAAIGQTEVPAGQQSTPGCPTSRPIPPIPPNAEQVAGMIGVLPLVQRMRSLASQCGTAEVFSVEELTLRQRIGEAVLTASLDLDGVLAEVDYERAQILDLREKLSGKRDRKVNVLTLASIIIGTGSGVAGTAMQFANPLAKAGDWIQSVGGAAGVALSIIALGQTGGEGSLGIAPNMLAPIFGRKPELRSVYPDDVWTYLNTVPATDPRVHVPWKSELIAEWIRLGRIGPPEAPESQEKIGQLASRIADQKPLSIDLLTDRSSMLLDLRSRLSLMSRDLRDLMKSVSIPPPH
jgi:hypothetical protein